MKVFAQVAWLVVVLWAGVAVAQTQGQSGAACPAPPGPPQVTVQYQADTVVYRHDLGAPELDALNRKIRQIDPPKVTSNTRTNGLTVERFDIKYTMDTRISPVGPNQFCAHVGKIAATVGITEHTVYIAKPYPVGSCEYTAIKEHEDTHVAINRRIVQASAPRVLAQLQLKARELPSVKAGSPQEAAGYFNGRIKSLVTQLVEEIKRELRAENTKFDSPTEYSRVAKTCKSW